jgi:hypothetical protein
MSVSELPKLPESPVEHRNRPAPKDKGDESLIAIYTSVGLHLSSWEMLEMFMSMLFSTLIGSYSHAAVRAYGAISSANGRREALEQAGQVFFHENDLPKEFEKFFGKLMDHFREAGARRNEIAHGVASKLQIDNVSRGCFLAPPQYNSRKTVSPFIAFRAPPDIKAQDEFHMFGQKYRYTSNDVDHFTTLLRQLSGCATELDRLLHVAVSERRAERSQKQ